MARAMDALASLGQKISNIGLNQFNVELNNESQAKQFAKQGALFPDIMNAMEQLSDPNSPVDEKQAVAGVLQKAGQAGVSPAAAMNMFTMASNITARAAAARNMSVNNFIKAQQAAAEKKLTMAKAKSEELRYDPANLAAIQTAKTKAEQQALIDVKSKPILQENLNRFAAAVSKIEKDTGKKISEIEEVNDIVEALDDIGGYFGIGGDDNIFDVEDFFGETTDSREELAALLADKILNDNPDLKSESRTLLAEKIFDMLSGTGNTNLEDVTEKKKKENVTGLPPKQPGI